MEKNKDNFTKGHTQIPHRLENLLPLLSLTSREYRLVLLIIRLTYGCQRRWAKLKYADLTVINISSSHADKVVSRAIDRKIIEKNGRKKEYRVNEEYISTILKNKFTSCLEYLKQLVRIQLIKRDFYFGNIKHTKKEIRQLLKKEILSYQKGKKKRLPKREVSVLKSNKKSTPKDNNKQKIKDNYRKSSVQNGNNNFFSKFKKINPIHFCPNTDTENAAKETWSKLEPDNPDSFGFYLSVAKKGLPAQIFYQFCSEIKQDRKIKNKGAAFVNKALSYLKYQEQEDE